MKISIIVPVYNEAATIETLLRRVWQQPLSGFQKEIIVVESNSKDGSREIVQRVVAELSSEGPHVFRLILQGEGKGKGNAVREGLVIVTGDIILIQDADLEYDVNDYPSLLEPILDGRTKFVLGSRHLNAATWKIRKFERDPFRAFLLNMGGLFFHGLFNLIYGQRLTDPTTMYKVFSRECISNLYFKADRFDFDFELLGKLIRAGYDPLEIPISYTSRGFEEGKKIRVLRDPLTWLVAIVRFRFGKLYCDERLSVTFDERLSVALNEPVINQSIPSSSNSSSIQLPIKGLGKSMREDQIQL